MDRERTVGLGEDAQGRGELAGTHSEPDQGRPHVAGEGRHRGSGGQVRRTRRPRRCPHGDEERRLARQEDGRRPEPRAQAPTDDGPVLAPAPESRPECRHHHQPEQRGSRGPDEALGSESGGPGSEMTSPHHPQSGHSQPDEAEAGPQRQPDPPVPGSTDDGVQSDARQHGDCEGDHDQAQVPAHAERQLVHQRSQLGHEDESRHGHAQDGDGEHLGPSSVHHGTRGGQHESDGPHVGGVADSEPVALGHRQGVEPLEDQIHDIVGGQGAVGALGVEEDRAGDERDAGQDEGCGQRPPGHGGDGQFAERAQDRARAPEPAGARGEQHDQEDEQPGTEQDQGVGLARVRPRMRRRGRRTRRRARRGGRAPPTAQRRRATPSRPLPTRWASPGIP